MAEKTKAKIKKPTAEKRLIQNRKRCEQNKAFKSQIRSALREVNDAIEKKEKEGIQEKLNLVYSMVDKGMNRNILKKNQASRIKARITARVAKI